MRTNQKILLILLISCLLIIPVLASDAPNNIYISDNIMNVNNTYGETGHGAGVTYTYDAVEFGHIEYTTPQMLKFWGNYVTGSVAQTSSINAKPASNSTWKYVTYFEHNTGKLVGTGKIGYTLGLYNDLYGYLTFDTWNIGNNVSGMTGDTVVDIRNASSNIQLGFEAGTWWFNTFGNTVVYSSPVNYNVYFAQNAIGVIGGYWEREYDYTSPMIVNFIRTPSYSGDMGDLYRYNTISNVIFGYWVPAGWQYVINDTSSQDLTNATVINQTPQVLQVINPSNGKIWLYSWGGNSTIQLYLNKTSAGISEPVGTLTQANTAFITRISYTYYPQGNRDKEQFFNLAGYSYKSDFAKFGNQWYAMNSSSWNFDIPVTETQVLQIGFMFGDPGTYTVKVYAIDYNSGQLLGSSTVDIPINSKPFQNLDMVYATDNYNNKDVSPFYLTLINTNTSAIITQGLQNKPYAFYAETGKYYTASVSATGYYNNSLTILQPAGPTGINVFLSSLENLPAVTQWTFLVDDSSDTTGTHTIQNALITLSDKQQGFTDSGGRFTFIVPKNTIYNYSISKAGYVTIGGNTTTWNTPTMITYISLYQQVNGSATPIPTPTPGGEGLGGLFYLLFRSIGIPAELVGVAGGMVITSGFAIGFLYIARHSDSSGMAALVGGGIGYMFSTLLGLFPIWVLLGACVIFGIIYATKLRTGE